MEYITINSFLEIKGRFREGKMKKLFLLIFFYLLILNISISAQGTFTGTELLARPTDHSITLNVVSSTALEAYVEYGTSSGIYTNTTSTVSQAANEPLVIVITGLTADTKYYYRLRYRVSGSASAFSARSENIFHTQRPKGSTFAFDITSDSHVNILLGSATTWQKTLTNVANDNADFLIDCGDTFAMDNVTSESGARTNYIFQRTSTKLGLVSPSLPIFLAAGNHEEQEAWHLDDHGNPVNSQPVWGTNAQKRYFPNPVPDNFYSGNTDTYSALDGDHLREDYYAWTWGNALFVVIDPFWYTYTKPFMGNTGGGESSDVGSGDRWDWTLGEQQYNWLKQTLDTSKATYKFLFMHHMTGGTQDYIRGGAYAALFCEWGGYNTNGTTYAFNTRRSGWYAPIHQVLVEDGVTDVFHGHDHQYAYENRDDVVYQSLPAAGFSQGFGIYSESNQLTIRALPSPGHLRVTVSPDSVIVDYVNTTTGNVTYSYTIQSPSVNVKAKIFLEGPYAGGATMSTGLTIPTSDPYSLGESVISIPDDVVDWVLVELRKGLTATSATFVSSRAAFIKNDGSIVDLNGTSPVEFNGVSAGNYYIIVKHRNHLGVMSASVVSLSSSSTLYDFTTASNKFYGESAGAKDLGSGVWGMIAGDGNGNGQVQNDDSENIWKSANGTSGYKNSDYNMNGQVQNDDNENYWKINNGKGSQVP